MTVRGKESAVFFWTCWVRNRYRLIAYLALGCALVLMGTLPVTMAFVHGHWVWVHPKNVTDAKDAWRYGVEHSALVMLFLLLFSAADLGSLGVGESAGRKEYDFLLTRPRARRHFVWTAYLAGLTQLCLLALIQLVVAVTTLCALTSRIYLDRLWPLSLGAFILSLLVFSVAFALSVATGSSRNGFELVLCFLVIYVALKSVMFSFWVFRFLWLTGDSHTAVAYDWLLTGQRVHYGVLLMMVAATAILPFLAQFGFERKDL
jgi:hypothetical protein